MDNITRNMSVPSATTGSRDSARLFTQPKVLVIAATVCCLLWGSSYPGIKIGYALLGITQNDIPSKLIFAGYRFVLAGLLLLILATLSKKPVFDLNRRHSGQLMLLGFTQTVIQYARRLWSLLLKYNQVGKVTVFNFLVPVLGTVLSAICLDENIMELKNLVALVVVCGGIWLVTRPAQRSADYSKAGAALGQGRGCRQGQG
ncbi:DMT family transporter [Paraburkholderia sp. WSM4177]|uniref:DMT family transporter n=1 Tax=unclassified Paraburkholderia TaxID=2615204 RepID=UPI0017B3C46E|nr:drug/metabolite transporter (DMT)-like permease [Paraburkholderia sp. WSM4177]MBB5483523.1 drug/metabolite transporter (DMT)-like permease [Paraburkholderia sp. WSM4180]